MSLSDTIDFGRCDQPLGKDHWCCLRLGHVGPCEYEESFTGPPGRHEFIPEKLGVTINGPRCTRCLLGEAEGNHLP